MGDCKSGRCPPRRSTQQNNLVEEWNKKHAVGVAVNVKCDDGSVLETITRSEAWLMGGHSAMVMVEGIAGGYSLERVSAR